MALSLLKEILPDNGCTWFDAPSRPGQFVLSQSFALGPHVSAATAQGKANDQIVTATCNQGSVSSRTIRRCPYEQEKPGARAEAPVKGANVLMAMSVSQQEPQAKIVINMLGAFEVFCDGHRVDPTRFGSRKARILLRWLAHARNSVVPNDVLLDFLWPDVPTKKALPSLQVRVSEVRKVLTPDKPFPQASERTPGQSSALLDRVDSGYRLRTLPGLLETDVDKFAATAAAALHAQEQSEALFLLQKAVHLYQGDYLSDDPYTEQWQSARERYRKMFITVAERLAEVYETARCYEDGIELLQRLLEAPDRDEGHYRKLIRLQYLNGDQAGALRTFTECRLFLQTEFDVQPMPETLRLLTNVIRQEDLGEDPAPGVEHGSTAIGPGHDVGLKTEWPFLGRRAELTRMQRKLADLLNGQGGIVWLHGPPGIGKTRFLQHALAEAARGREFRTMWIHGSHLNARIPFAAVLDGLQIGLKPDLTPAWIRQLMTPASSRLQRLTGWDFPAHDGPSGADTTLQGSGAMPDAVPEAVPDAVSDAVPDAAAVGDVLLRQEFLGLFERLTQQMPLVCCLDHVHTLDSASRALLLALARRAHKWPLLIVATSRRVPQQVDVGEELLNIDAPTSIMHLKALSPAALRPLIGRGIPSLWTRRWLRQLHAATGGEPHMLAETLQALRRKHLIDLDDGKVVFPSGLLELMTDAAAADAVPEALHVRQDEFEQTWSELDDSERSLLQKAAALRDLLTLERLERLAALPPQAFQQAVDRVVRLGYLTTAVSVARDNANWSFTHHRIQQRTYRTLTRSERLLCHRRIFELLEAEAKPAQGDDEWERSTIVQSRLLSGVAFHALSSGQWEAAARWSLRAAAAAKSITPGPEVVSLCRQACRAAERTGQRDLADEARSHFAEALFYVGSYNEAIPLYETLTDVDSPHNRLASRRLITMYLRLNRVDAAQVAAEQMLLHAGDDTRARARADLNIAYINYRRGQLKQAVAGGTAVLTNLQTEQYDVDRALAHRRMALFRWELGEYGDALEHAGTSVRLLRSADVPELIESLNHLGELYQDLFCTTLALEVHREALDLALDHGRLVLSVEIWRNLGLDFVHQGRVHKGLKTLERAWQQVQDLNLEPYWREVHLRSLLEAKLLAHRPDEVRGLLAQYKEAIGPRETPFVTVFSVALAFLEGRIDEAEELLAQVQAFWQQTGRRARAAHVLLFAGQQLMLHGHPERGRTQLELALQELEHICRFVPAEVANHIRSSRQYAAVRSLLGAVPKRAR